MHQRKSFVVQFTSLTFWYQIRKIFKIGWILQFSLMGQYTGAIHRDIHRNIHRGNRIKPWNHHQNITVWVFVSSMNHQPWTMNHTINHEPSTMNHQPSQMSGSGSQMSQRLKYQHLSQMSASVSKHLSQSICQHLSQMSASQGLSVSNVGVLYSGILCIRV